MPATLFLSDDEAEDRNVYCGNCSEPVKGHLPRCPHCDTEFHPNKWGYARLCKGLSCMRTEMNGHAHGLCRFHRESRRQKQIMTAKQPTCYCGNKARLGQCNCSRCRELKSQ